MKTYQTPLFSHSASKKPSRPRRISQISTVESVLFLQIFLRFLPRPKYQKSELVYVKAAVLDGSY